MLKIIHPIFSHTGINKFLPGIAWFFFSAFLLLIPGSDLPKAGNWLDKIFFDKWVHVGLFAVAAFLFIVPVMLLKITDVKKMWMITFISLFLSGWGLAVEFLQKNYVPSRDFDLADWAADILGVLMAVLFLARNQSKIYAGV